MKKGSEEEAERIGDLLNKWLKDLHQIKSDNAEAIVCDNEDDIFKLMQDWFNDQKKLKLNRRDQLVHDMLGVYIAKKENGESDELIDVIDDWLGARTNRKNRSKVL